MSLETGRKRLTADWSATNMNIYHTIDDLWKGFMGFGEQQYLNRGHKGESKTKISSFSNHLL